MARPSLVKKIASSLGEYFLGTSTSEVYRNQIKLSRNNAKDHLEHTQIRNYLRAENFEFILTKIVQDTMDILGLCMFYPFVFRPINSSEDCFRILFGLGAVAAAELDRFYVRSSMRNNKEDVRRIVRDSFEPYDKNV